MQPIAELVLGVDKMETLRLLRAIDLLPLASPTDVYRTAAFISSPRTVQFWLRSGGAEIYGAWTRRMETARKLRSNLGLLTVFMMPTGLLVLSQTRPGVVEWQVLARPGTVADDTAARLLDQVVRPYLETWDGHCEPLPSFTLLDADWSQRPGADTRLWLARAIAMAHEPTVLFEEGRLYERIDALVDTVIRYTQYVEYVRPGQHPPLHDSDRTPVDSDLVQGEIARSILAFRHPDRHPPLVINSDMVAEWQRTPITATQRRVIARAGQLVLFPLSLAGHWSLLVYHPTAFRGGRIRLVHFDSLPAAATHAAAAQRMAAWLNVPESALHRVRWAPGQTQVGAECGHYVIALAALLIGSNALDHLVFEDLERSMRVRERVLDYYRTNTTAFWHRLAVDNAYPPLQHGIHHLIAHD